jgi:hypothetical protein
LANWFEAGGSLTEFWQATPRIVTIAVNAYLRRRTITAWQTAGLSRADHKYPDLDALLGDIGGAASAPEPQSEEELDHAIRVWNELLSKRVEE